MADINVIDDSGNIFLLPEVQLPAAQAQGYSLATPEQIAHYDKVKAAGGVVGGIAAASGGAANTLSFGAFKPALRKMAPGMADTLEAAQEAHPVLSGAGTAAGFIGSLGSPLVKTATATGQKVLGSVAPAVEEVAGQFAGKVLGRAAQFGTEGAILGAPKAVMEAATGEYQEAAETMIASGGLSALLGGAVGGIEGGFTAARPYLEQAGAWAMRKGERSAQNLRMKSTGNTKFLRARMTPEDFNELDRFQQEKIWSKGLFQHPEDLHRDAAAAIEQSGRDIGEVFRRIDDAGFFVDGRKAQDAINGLGSKISKFTTSSPVRKAWKNARADLASITETEARNFVEPGPRVSFSALKEWKDTLGAKGYSETGQKLKGPVAKFYAKLERQIDSLIEDGLEEAERVNQLPMNQRGLFAMPVPPENITADWKEAKYLYKNWARTMPGLRNLLSMQSNKALGLGDYASAGIGGVLGGFPGAVAGYLFSEAKDQFGAQVGAHLITKTLKGVRDVNKYVTEWSGKALSSDKVSSLRASSLGTLRELTGIDDRHEATDAVVDELSRLATDPGYASERIASAIGPVGQSNEKLAFEAQQQLLNSAHALLEVAPKRDIPSPFESDRGHYTNGQVSDFERQLHVAMNPFSVMEDIAHGTLDPGAVKMLERLYPNLYGRMQTAILNQATSKTRPYSYGKKLNLSLFFGKQVDALGAPHNIKALQKNFIKTEQQSPKTGKTKKYGEDYATKAQTIENR